MKLLFNLLMILCFLAVGCSQKSPKLSNWEPKLKTGVVTLRVPKQVKPSAVIQTLARINDQPITMADLQAGLLEAAGGQLLAEKVLSLQLHKKLGSALITQQDIQNERARFVASLHSNPQLAEKLLAQLKQRQGLGKERFADFLFRQAALRKLVEPQVTVTDKAIRQAFELKYGPMSVVQIILTDSPAQAVKILNLARKGRDFALLVNEYSQDPRSKASNGMLPPISPADATFPIALHKAIKQCHVGQISDVVALDNGFAILKLVSKNQRQAVLLEDVRSTLAAAVRLDVEQMLMRQLAATLMDQAQVVVLDRELNQSWQASQRNLQIESVKP